MTRTNVKANYIWWVVLLGIATLVPGNRSLKAKPFKPLPQTKLMRRAEPAVFAHAMVSFGTPGESGRWQGWNQSGRRGAHDPTRRKQDGRLDIASVFYPSIGPYDMTDPATVEYHCQLLKMAGIDGLMFDLGFYYTPGDEDGDATTWNVRAMRMYRKTMKAYDLRAVVIYEDKVHWKWNKNATNRTEAVRASHRDMSAWLELFSPIQYRIDGRPLFGVYSYRYKVEGKGLARLLPEELKTWLNRFPPGKRPVTVTQGMRKRYRGVHAGPMHWVLQGRPPTERKQLRKYGDLEYLQNRVPKRIDRLRRRLRAGHYQFAVSGAWPGFNDRAIWGWGKGPRYTARQQGKVYRYLLHSALKIQLPVVQLITWNDWFDGTVIEPTVEHGTSYLERTRLFAAQHKGGDTGGGNLSLPIWIYRIRKRTENPDALKAMDQASSLIREGRYGEAEKVVRPWLNKFSVDEVRYWPPESISSDLFGDG